MTPRAREGDRARFRSIEHMQSFASWGWRPMRGVLALRQLVDRSWQQGARTMADGTLVGWERALMAAEKVKERLRRATKALDGAGVPYAVAGGNAVAEWVGRVDEGAVRNTRDVDLLLRRADLPAARAALEAAGFVYHQVMHVDMFIDGPQGRPSEAVHLLFAGEKLRPEDQHALPALDNSER